MSGLMGQRSQSMVRVAAGSQTQVRWLNVHEFAGCEIMQKFDVPTARGGVATSVEEALQVAEELGGDDFVIKSQILAGGRGKGTFTNGFKGGVHMASSRDEVSEFANKMLGGRLVTKQTPPEGLEVNKLFITERVYVRRETYFAILLDRDSASPVLVASSEGGMNIEEVAETNPEKIFKEYIDIEVGPTDDQLERLAIGSGFRNEATPKAMEIFRNLYTLFEKTDSTQVEINPLAETHDGRVLCLDSKLNFDDNAAFRQKEVNEYRDESQEDPREVEAQKYGCEYVGLDGSIGCMVNGAGLAMATMDEIKLWGGEPANFLDLGGGATQERVSQAFQILHKDPQVKAILINIFGGIMRCDIIALGIINAAKHTQLSKPVVIRLEGTKVDEAKEVIEGCGLRLLNSDNLSDAASKACKIAQMRDMAEDIGVTVDFELSL